MLIKCCDKVISSCVGGFIGKMVCTQQIIIYCMAERSEVNER